MNSILVPVSNGPITFVRIGNSYNYPSIDDMEAIRKWVMDHRKVWLNHRKELPRLFGYDIKVRFWSTVTSDKSYMALINRADPDVESYWSQEDVQAWKDVFEESADDPDFIVFVWGGLSIKRFNKILVPFF